MLFIFKKHKWNTIINKPFYFILFLLQDGSTLLHLAAKCGHPVICNYLTTKGVLVQMPNKVNFFSISSMNTFTQFSIYSLLDNNPRKFRSCLLIFLEYTMSIYFQLILKKFVNLSHLESERKILIIFIFDLGWCISITWSSASRSCSRCQRFNFKGC